MRTLQRRLVRVAAAAVAVVGWGAVIVAPTGASAAIVTTPAGLGPGDPYRLAFVTLGTINALSGDINVYNAFVQAEADAQMELFDLGATWKAIGSTATVDARDNTDTNPSSTGVPIYLLDGTTKIADNNVDLWDGSIDFPFNIFVDGTPVPVDPSTNKGLQPWTGSISAGVQLAFKFLGANGTTASVAGETTAVSTTWTRDLFFEQATLHPLYAISSELTVAAVPLPGALILFGSGLACLAVLRRRNRSVRPA